MEREAKFKESRNVSKRSLARGELYQAKLKAHLRLDILLDNLENRERETDDSDSAGNIIYIYIYTISNTRSPTLQTVTTKGKNK